MRYGNPKGSVIRPDNTPPDGGPGGSDPQFLGEDLLDRHGVDCELAAEQPPAAEAEADAPRLTAGFGHRQPGLQVVQPAPLLVQAQGGPRASLRPFPVVQLSAQAAALANGLQRASLYTQPNQIDESGPTAIIYRPEQLVAHSASLQGVSYDGANYLDLPLLSEK